MRKTGAKKEALKMFLSHISSGAEVIAEKSLYYFSNKYLYLPPTQKCEINRSVGNTRQLGIDHKKHKKYFSLIQPPSVFRRLNRFVLKPVKKLKLLELTGKKIMI